MEHFYAGRDEVDRDDPAAVAQYFRDVRRRIRYGRPPLRESLLADARAFDAYLGRDGPPGWGRVAQLCLTKSSFLALALYRLRTTLEAKDVPLLPRLLHLASTVAASLRIGEYVVLGAGVCFPDGQSVIDGGVLVGRGCVISGWTTLGVQRKQVWGPVLGENVYVGPGAKVVGELRVGPGARIEANAVVTQDVPAGETFEGVPARPVAKPA